MVTSAIKDLVLRVKLKECEDSQAPSGCSSFTSNVRSFITRANVD